MNTYIHTRVGARSHTHSVRDRRPELISRSHAFKEHISSKDSSKGTSSKAASKAGRRPEFISRSHAFKEQSSMRSHPNNSKQWGRGKKEVGASFVAANTSPMTLQIRANTMSQSASRHSENQL